MAGHGVAAFFQAVVALACGEAIELVAGPAPGRGSYMIYLAPACRYMAAGPVTLAGGELYAESG